MRMNTLTLLSCLFCSSVLSAQDSVLEEAKKDLLESQQRLNEQRAKFSEEKLALSTEVTKLRSERDSKNKQVQLARRSTESKNSLLAELKGKEYASNVEVTELNQMIHQYGIQLDTKFFPGEPNDNRLQALYKKSSNTNQLLKDRFSTIEAGLERLENSIGGKLVQATTSKEDAEIIQGTVAHFGPLNWFSSEDKSAAGQYIISPSGEVASLTEANKEAVESLVKGEQASVSIDITGGKATALASIKQGPLDLIKKGGAWIYPILGIAAFALISAILKFLQLIRLKHLGSEWTQQIAEHYINGDIDQAQQLAEKPSHPISSVLPECIHAAQSGLDVAEEVLYEKMIAVRNSLRSLLPFIAITAATAPMLGLLGTVSGLIRTFSVITIEGTGEAQSISGGISEALITTLFGLSVAIPAFIAHALLSRKAKGVEQTTERVALRFINHVRLHK